MQPLSWSDFRPLYHTPKDSLYILVLILHSHSGFGTAALSVLICLFWTVCIIGNIHKNLGSFIYHNVLKIHPYCSVCQHTPSFLMTEWYSILWIYHCCLFSHLLVDIWIVSNESCCYDIHIQVFVWTCFHFSVVRYLGMKLLGLMVKFSKIVPFCIPTSNTWEF